MAITTNFAYCDSTCNYLVGCSGCELYPNHCYANSLVTRHAGKNGWPKSFTQPELFLGRVDEALRWKDLTGTAGPERNDKPWLNGMPRVVFVNDLGDLCSPAADNGLVLEMGSCKILERMAASPHIWIFLTKWPQAWPFVLQELACGTVRDGGDKVAYRWITSGDAPPNIWLGVSVTDQATANERIPALLNVGAAVRFVSCEPMLGRIGFTAVQTKSRWPGKAEPSKMDCLRGFTYSRRERFVLNGIVEERGVSEFVDTECRPIDWIILGGESGSGRQTLDVAGMEIAANQCLDANVPVFVKQDSGPRPGKQGRISDGLWKVKEMPEWPKK